jgi:Zn-dependent alcohol dehydrogenase
VVPPGASWITLPENGKPDDHYACRICREPRRPWRLVDLELDEPKAIEVRIRFAAGMCHSDDHIRKGDAYMRFPVVGGHEGAGIWTPSAPT